MKFIKNTFRSIISGIALLSISLSAIDLGPGFELFNKAKNPITVTIFKFGSSSVIYKATVGANKKLPYKIDLKLPIEIRIDDSGVSEISQGAIGLRKYEIYDLSSALGLTKYLTWNPAKAPYLYPQTGPLAGFLGKSESGYPLGKTNIEQEDIRKESF